MRAGFTRLTTCPASLSAIATSSLHPPVASRQTWRRPILRFVNHVCSCPIPAPEFGTLLEAERFPCKSTACKSRFPTSIPRTSKVDFSVDKPSPNDHPDTCKLHVKRGLRYGPISWDSG